MIVKQHAWIFSFDCNEHVFYSFPCLPAIFGRSEENTTSDLAFRAVMNLPRSNQTVLLFPGSLKVEDP